MLVYGDRSRSADPRAELADLARRLDAVEALPPGLERHAGLVSAMIEAGALAQGLADAAFEARAVDAPDLAPDLALAGTRALAEAVVRSWRGGFAAPPVDRTALARLAGLALPERVRVKEGEGYAFYALYPETYAEAAAVLASAPTLVVGLRSIGTSLGAVVAAALDAEPLISVRPTGHPFRRELSVDPALAPQAGERVAVVDEGPGLSGSSFGAAFDWAEAAGAPRERLMAFPSHAGDLGPEALPTHRERWAGLRKPFVSFEQAIAPRLPAWAADFTGPLREPPQDLSGGRWRALRYRSQADWPAANAAQERRKLLLRGERGTVLLKFAGLGRIGERKLARARALAADGFTPEPLGLRHGFLAERWINASARRPSRAEIEPTLTAYLAKLADGPSEPEEAGAGLSGLLEMARVNVGEALGSEAAEALEPWVGRLPALSAEVRRVRTDNRLHAHEWIEAPGGRWLKTDALDHSEAHDLVGCQDLAWDVAGAAVEFDLDPDQSERLARAVGVARSPELLAFHRIAYLAFQLGAAHMAAQAHAGWPEEHARLRRARERYGAKLRRALGPA